MVVDERTRDEIEGIAPDLQDELIKHPGKWAAITSTKILALEDNPMDAYRKAREQGIEEPILYHIPDNRAGFSYF
jgi:hypothetical protein